jgi:hypothetical protein
LDGNSNEIVYEFFQDGSDFQAKLTLTTLGPMVGKMFFFGEKSPIRTYTRLSAAKQALDYLMAHPLSQGRIDLSQATKDPNRKKNKGVKKSHWKEGHSGKGKGKGGGGGGGGDVDPTALMSNMMQMMGSVPGKGKGKAAAPAPQANAMQQMMMSMMGSMMGMS